MRYVKRYTNDLYVIGESDTLSDLTFGGDYKVHVIDTENNNEVVWQNAPSTRYGNKGVA